MASPEAARPWAAPQPQPSPRSTRDAAASKRDALASIQAAERSLAERTRAFTAASEAMRTEIRNFDAAMAKAKAQLEAAERRLAKPATKGPALRLVEPSDTGMAATRDSGRTAGRDVEPSRDLAVSRRERLLFEFGGALIGLAASVSLLRFVLL